MKNPCNIKWKSTVNVIRNSSIPTEHMINVSKMFNLKNDLVNQRITTHILLK